MSAITVPTQCPSRRVTDTWIILPAWLPIPGMGVLPINSFLLKGKESVLVDTGLAALSEAYMSSLEREVDLDDLRWIWLSHMDADHSGNLGKVLERAPNATVITNFLGMGKMNLAGLDVSRVQLLEPGSVFEADGHRLIPLRPPYYDAPETIGFFDEQERVLFTADSFGALLAEVVDETVDIADTVLRDGLVGWSSIDAPWLADIDRGALGRELQAIESLDPSILLSGHLPVARHGVKTLTQIIADAYINHTAVSADPLSLEHITSALGRPRAA